MGESAHAPRNQNNNKRVEGSWLADERSLALGVRTGTNVALLSSTPLCTKKELFTLPTNRVRSVLFETTASVLYSTRFFIVYTPRSRGRALRQSLCCCATCVQTETATLLRLITIESGGETKWCIRRTENKTIAVWSVCVCVCICARARWREWLFIQFLKSGAPVKV